MIHELRIHRTELELQNEELRRAQLEIESSRDKYANLYDFAPIGYVTLDQAARIREVNHAAAVLLGMDRSPLIGKSMTDFAGRGEQAAFRRFLGDATGRQACTTCDLRLGRAGGTPFHAQLDCQASLSHDGRADAVLLAIQDITTRKQAEEQCRQQNERLEELVRERLGRIHDLERQRSASEQLAAAGRLAAGIAHEINNPLAGIKSSFHLIRDCIPDSHPFYEYVGRIELEIDRIARIVHLMFDLYAPVRPPTEEFSIRIAIEDVLMMMRAKAAARDVQIHGELPDASVNLRQPRGAFIQVLFNLLCNAVEFSPSGERVDVKAGIAEEVFHLSVGDHGPGIPREIQARVFEPFFSTHEGHPGENLGLGLSISRSLVDAMGGRITLQSDIGRGAVFSVLLPCVMPAA